MMYFFVFLGGGLGSLLRFGLGRAFQRYSEIFPWGTLVANLLACLLLAIIVFLLPEKLQSDNLKFFYIAGFCGGFSTFSTFGLELFQLMKNAQFGMAGLYLLSSILVSLVLFWALSTRLT